MKKRDLRLCLAFAAVLVFGTVLRLFTYAASENSLDGFYHMRVSRQGWSVYAQKTFPMVTLSSWEECYADKELLYHILLSGADRVRGWLRLPEFPFHFGALFFFALLCGAFALCAKAVELKNPEYPLLLFLAVTPFFCNRMLMLRPHTFAVALMLFCCAVYAKCPARYLTAGAFLCGALFSWGYSNPHFVFLAAGGFAFGFFWTERARSYRLLAGTALGLAAGFILHPQFPNNCINWYIQCVVVPKVMSGQLRIVELGTEVQYSGIGMWRLLWPLFLLQLSCISLAVYLFRRDRKRTRLTKVPCPDRKKDRIGSFGRISAAATAENAPIRDFCEPPKGTAGVLAAASKRLFDPEMLAVGSIFAVTVLGEALALRAVEYAQPFSALCFAMLLERALPERPAWHKGQAILYALLFLAGVWDCRMSLYPTELDLRPPEKLAAFVRSVRIPPGAVIANHEWALFPMLYYSMPEYRYLCGLDPCFAVAVDPLRIARIEAQRRNVNHTLFTPADFADVVRARLLHVRHGELAKRLCENGYGKYLIYQGEDGYLFHLPVHPR